MTNEAIEFLMNLDEWPANSWDGAGDKFGTLPNGFQWGYSTGISSWIICIGEPVGDRCISKKMTGKI